MTGGNPSNPSQSEQSESKNFNARNPKIDFRKSIIAKIGFRKSIFGFRAIRVNPSNPSRPQIIACNHIFGKLVHIFRKLVHIFAQKLVSRTSKQFSKNLGPLWQPGVYNDTDS